MEDDTLLRFWSPVAVVVAIGLTMIALERVRPGRPWPRVAGWWPRALALNACQVATVWLAGTAWDGWMQRHRPWSADALGVTGGALVGYAVITFVYYWWHRWRHEVGWLWRWFHQVHHSPQRIEVITSFYKHPFELVVNGLISSVVLYLVVGLAPPAASLAVLITGLAELFYHWNVATPHWLGYVIQRPESHCIHHEAGVHAFNYSDLPIWDMLFSTFRNPRAWRACCGFGDDEVRLGAMLAGIDLSAPREGTA
jgi:sterol desaturase/sphingolipid hydroxylase (fatty acid hydroxylase superfamily)